MNDTCWYPNGHYRLITHSIELVVSLIRTAVVLRWKIFNHIFLFIPIAGRWTLVSALLRLICTISCISRKTLLTIYSLSRLLLHSLIMINVQLGLSVLIVFVCLINTYDDPGIFIICLFSSLYIWSWYPVILNSSVYITMKSPTSSSKKSTRTRRKERD